MIKYKVVDVCVKKIPYGECITSGELEKAFEEGWQYVACNQIGNWLQYILKKEEN